jgi:hypothetical protein
MPDDQRRPSRPGLTWLGQALGAVPADHPDAGQHRYVLMPSRSRPQMVLSLGEPGAGWASLHRHSDAAPLKVRVARELWAWACRTGLAGLIFSPPMPDSAVGLRTGSLPWPDLMAEIFGRTDLTVAISVGQLRPQIKPILHVATKDGRLLGHIKVGWNDVTRSLVRHEAAILLALTGPDGPPGSAAGADQPAGAGCVPHLTALRVPRVLHHGEWHGRDVLAVSDVGGSPWYRRRRMSLPTSATWQAGRALGVDREALSTSMFWSDLSARAKRLMSHAAMDAGLAADLAAVLDIVESGDAATELDFGLMHGDWAPWNMATFGSTLAVWDWERARIRGPIGFDGAFFRFQVDLWIRGMRPDQALSRSRSALAETMAACGAAPQSGPVILRLVLLEVALRQLEGVAAGAPVPGRVYRALNGLLRESLALGGALAESGKP